MDCGGFIYRDHLCLGMGRAVMGILVCVVTIAWAATGAVQAQDRRLRRWAR
jgi:hypothetical protein